MVIIADSGSTKTDWAIINGEDVAFLKTEGILPRQMSKETIATISNQALFHLPKTKNTSIYFYGTGCSHASSKEKLLTALKKQVPNANISIKTDLDGAAVAMFGDSAGIIAILGTGSNCGYWNGNTITEKPASIGYLLGDEGSGFYIGKLLCEYYLKGNMPSELSNKFMEWTGSDAQGLIEALYKTKKPNRYIAQFAPFASEYCNDDFIRALLSENFDLFFRDYITKLKNCTALHIKIVGSVAVAFEKYIKNSAWKFGCSVSSTAGTIIEKIAEYHKTQENPLLK